MGKNNFFVLGLGGQPSASEDLNLILQHIQEMSTSIGQIDKQIKFLADLLGEGGLKPGCVQYDLVCRQIAGETKSKLDCQEYMARLYVELGQMLGMTGSSPHVFGCVK